MEYLTILIKRKIIIIGFIGFIGFDLPTAGRDPCNSCNTMITILGDDFLHMLKLMTLPPEGEGCLRSGRYCGECGWSPFLAR